MNEIARIAVCVDDTDDVTKSTSTGAVAETIADEIAALGGTLELGISRHQLLLDDSVPYTSHNSSMAFTAQIPEANLDELRTRAQNAIRSMMADSADPGLCIARIPNDQNDSLLYELMSFGRAAKERYVSKQEAYELAESIDWISLEELGGDGQGVVGALAGVGLRLSGSDGRFRGKWNLTTPSGADSCTSLEMKVFMESRVNGPVLFVDRTGKKLPDSTMVLATDEAKPMLYAGCMTIVTEIDADGMAHPCTKTKMKDGGLAFSDASRSCSSFELDNDIEELGANEDVVACPNCLYRRWTSHGFTCMKTEAR